MMRWPPPPAFCRVLFTAACLAQALPASAEVAEALQYKRYTATQRQGDSLLHSLNRATPIQHNGQRYHGHTAWTIRWQYLWDRQANGRCASRSLQTQLTITITMPQLVSSDPAAHAEFQRYHSALHRHEMGHAGIARDAARDIHLRIRTVPSMASCEDLERHIQQLGQGLIAQAIEREQAHDRRTRHGRTDGASLID